MQQYAPPAATLDRAARIACGTGARCTDRSHTARRSPRPLAARTACGTGNACPASRVAAGGAAPHPPLAAAALGGCDRHGVRIIHTLCILFVCVLRCIMV